MARPGVTFSEVAEAAVQLIGEGKNPTIEQVRLIIGNGSNSTLANHLRRWKAEQAGDSLLAVRENIPPTLVSMLKGLWDGVIHEAESKMTAAASGYEDVIAELKEELQKYKSNNQRWQKLHDQWQQEKERLLTERSEQDERLAALKQQYMAMESRWEVQSKQLEEKQGRIDELHQLHQQAQTNLEHYRESVREQRLAESLVSEKRETVLQQEIAGLKAVLAVAEKGRVDADRAFTASQTECQGLQGTLARMNDKNNRLQQVKQSVENEHIRLLAEYDGLAKREAGLQEKYSEAQRRILDLEKNTVSLAGQLQSVGESLNRAEHTAATLEYEKRFWEEERIQLKNTAGRKVPADVDA